MAETYEIKQYSYYAFSSQNADGVNAVVLLYGDKYLGGAFFIKAPTSALKPAIKYASGVIGLYYDMGDLPMIIDMLRNEKPVYLIYDGAANSRISTTSEPVGEGEV